MGAFSIGLGKRRGDVVQRQPDRLGVENAEAPDRVARGHQLVRAQVAGALARIADRVRLTGALPPDRLARIYAAADLLVWPAIQEAYGMALLEAQAAGLPVLAGDAGGVPDIVRHGSTGVLVPEGDAGAFTAALGGLLDDPGRLPAMGEAARRTVQAEHGLDAAAAALDGWLRRAVAEYRR